MNVIWAARLLAGARHVRVLQLIVPRSTTSWEAILTPFWWSIAPNRLKSPVFAWSRAPCDGKFLPKVVVFGVRRGTISWSTCSLGWNQDFYILSARVPTSASDQPRQTD